MKITQLGQLINQLVEFHKKKSVSGEVSLSQYELNEIISRFNLDLSEKPEVRNVCILLSDIRGFTSLSEKFDAAVIFSCLNTYFQSMGEIIKKYGGEIDKYIGDSIMAVFDITDDAEISVCQSLSAAIEMQIAMQDVNKEIAQLGIDPLYIGMGINHGLVFSGAVGSDFHRELTIIGDQVNVAARIESFSLRGQILISNSIYECARNNIEVGESNEVTVKGKSKSIKIYELIGINKPEKLTLPDREPRKFPRVDVNLPTSFQLLKGKEVSPDIYAAKIVDIGYRGISLENFQI